MGVRFNKRITLFPWLRANVGKSGISLTIGPKGKTLNVGSTGVSINVNLGKGVGYSKRLITWRKLNLLGWLGLGGTAAAKGAKSRRSSSQPQKDTREISLDEALAEAEATSTTTAEDNAQQQEQPGCSWGCALLGCLGVLILLALLVVIVVLLWRSGTIDLSGILPAA